MRLFVILVAALASLGLAAFGVVSAQKAISPTASTTVRVASTPTSTPVAPRAPVNQVAQATVSDAPVPAAVVAAHPVAELSTPAAPTRVAENAPVPNTAAPPPASSAPQSNAAPNKPNPQASNIPPCDKPGGMGLSRIVEIDTTGGPGFGFEHFKQYDFLRDKEVVLTFDDGPWPGNTPAVLKALTDQCLKATFFEIGEHAMSLAYGFFARSLCDHV
jgi:hypothetical protein